MEKLILHQLIEDVGERETALGYPFLPLAY